MTTTTKPLDVYIPQNKLSSSQILELLFRYYLLIRSITTYLKLSTFHSRGSISPSNGDISNKHISEQRTLTQ